MCLNPGSQAGFGLFTQSVEIKDWFGLSELKPMCFQISFKFLLVLLEQEADKAVRGFWSIEHTFKHADSYLVIKSLLNAMYITDTTTAKGITHIRSDTNNSKNWVKSTRPITTQTAFNNSTNGRAVFFCKQMKNRTNRATKMGAIITIS